MRKTTSLRLPEDLRDRLTVAAEQHSTTLTALMERYAREGLATDAHPGFLAWCICSGGTQGAHRANRTSLRSQP